MPFKLYIVAIGPITNSTVFNLHNIKFRISSANWLKIEIKVSNSPCCICFPKPERKILCHYKHISGEAGSNMSSKRTSPIIIDLKNSGNILRHSKFTLLYFNFSAKYKYGLPLNQYCHWSPNLCYKLFQGFG